MSEPNVELVVASYEKGNRERRLDRDVWHPDGVYVNSREDPDHGEFHGMDEIEKLFASWLEAYPDARVEPLETQASGDTVFVWVRLTGEGAESGLPLDMELAHVITIEDGLIKRLEEYVDREEALRVAGLA